MGAALGPTSIRWLLICGVLTPFLYFGAQLIAAPLYPGYDAMRQAASDLGARGASSATVFNAGALLTGVASCLGGFGAFFALLRERIHGLGAALVALCFLSNGFGAVNAFLHPLPDPAHNPGMLQVGIFALPIVGLFVVWFLRDAVVTKSLLLFALAAFAAIAAIMSGLIPVVVSEAEGLWQRVAVAVLYAPLLTISASLWIRAAQPRIAQTE